MKGENLCSRTCNFAVKILNLSSGMPTHFASQTVLRQIVRSSTSVGANYRAACRSKSRRDFVNKLKIVEEELDETLYWLEVIAKCGFLETPTVDAQMKEGNELLAIIVKSIQTARANMKEC